MKKMLIHVLSFVSVMYAFLKIGLKLLTKLGSEMRDLSRIIEVGVRGTCFAGTGSIFHFHIADKVPHGVHSRCRREILVKDDRNVQPLPIPVGHRSPET